MKLSVRGFTLLEIIVVIIIIGVLSTLASKQYANAVERSRGAEARQICGNIRMLAQSHFLESQNLLNPLFTSAAANIGTGNDQNPSVCRQSHYFRYSIALEGSNSLRITATRCSSNGKRPNFPSGCGASAPTYIVTPTLDTGAIDIDSGIY